MSMLQRFKDSPAFTLVVVGTLGLTVGRSTTVFSVLDAVFVRPLPFRDISQIFAMQTIAPQGYTQPASYPEYHDWRRDSSGFAVLAAYNSFRAVNAEIEGSAISLHAVATSDNFFDVFGVRPILGRTFQSGEEEPGRNFVTVLSNEVWRNVMGGRADAIGSKIKLDGLPYTIIGVMPPAFRFPISQTDAIYFPLNMPQSQRQARGSHWLPTVAKLLPGISPQDAQREFNRIFEHLGQVYPATKNRRVKLIDVATFTIGGSNGALRLLGLAVLALIAVGCVNLAGLLIVRGVSREHEFAVRSALGASRRRTVMQLLGENLAQAVAGGVLGVLLASGLLDATRALLVAALNRGGEVELNRNVRAASLVLSILTSLVAGLWPALRLSSVSAVESLRSGQRGGMDRRQGRLRALFVTVQVALALVLLVTSGLVFRALSNLRGADFGFEPSHILTAEINLSPGGYETSDVVANFYTPMLDRVRAMHGVQSAGLIQILPIKNWGWNSDIQIIGQPPAPPDKARLAEFRLVTPGYFPAFGIRLVKGRLLDDKLDTPTSQAVMVVNQKFVERFIPPDLDPIGQAIRDGNGKVVIIGVVSNVRQNVFGPALAEMDFPISQVPQAQRKNSLSSMALAIRTDNDPLSLIPDLRGTFENLDRSLPFRTPETMEQVIANSLTLQRLENWLFGSFAVLALVLAMIGLYGLISHEVETSRRELGIRIAVGATRARIFASIYSRVAVLVGIGIAAGLVGVWAARTAIAAVAPIQPEHDIQLLAGLVLAFILVALAAAFLPAWRAATLDPIRSLRAD